jgi:F0F1-type ATP synthase delta subunit
MTDPERDRSVQGMAGEGSEPHRSPIEQQLESALVDGGHRLPGDEPFLGAEEERPRSAVIRVAAELYEGEVEALKATLERHFGPLDLQIEVDRSILGGVWVQVGDTVIDGSLSRRLGRMGDRSVPKRRPQSPRSGQSTVRLGEPGPILSVDRGLPGRGRGRPRLGVMMLALDPSETEVEDLRAALEAYFGSPLVLEVEVDPKVLGGVLVQVEGIVIDGSLRGRLGALRDHLHAQVRAMLSASTTPAPSQRGARRTA